MQQPHAAQRRLGARELAEAERADALPRHHGAARAQHGADHGVRRAARDVACHRTRRYDLTVNVLADRVVIAENITYNFDSYSSIYESNLYLLFLFFCVVCS